MGATFQYGLIPAEYAAHAQEYRANLVEAACEANEVLTDKFLEGVEISEADIISGLRARTLNLEVVPVCCGSAFKNKGIQSMLDKVIEVLPAPNNIPAVTGLMQDGEVKAERLASDQESFSALAFKIAADSHVGTLAFLRCYSGVLKTGDMVLNSTKGKRERIGRLLQMHANSREEISAVRAGDIAAAVGLKSIGTGDTLCDVKKPIVLERISFPDPVISVAVEPKTKSDQEKMAVVLSKLTLEDPSLQVSTDNDLGQTIISGMGELHLDIVIERMRREYKLNVSVGKPQVAYRETVFDAAKGESKFIRQAGGRGHYAHVVLEIEPGMEGEGFEFVNKIVDGVIPKEYIPAIEKGISGALFGVLAGYPLVDIKVTLEDGSYHEVDSSEQAFKTASAMALRQAVLKAKPTLLEPLMEVEITTPEESMGDVIGDLNARRGQIASMEKVGLHSVVSAQVPLGEMFEYATHLRGLTKGRATHNIEFSNYAEVPGNIAESIVHKMV